MELAGVQKRWRASTTFSGARRFPPDSIYPVSSGFKSSSVAERFGQSADAKVSLEWQITYPREPQITGAHKFRLQHFPLKQGRKSVHYRGANYLKPRL
jgi:hypothetical protein